METSTQTVGQSVPELKPAICPQISVIAKELGYIAPLHADSNSCNKKHRDRPFQDRFLEACQDVVRYVYNEYCFFPGRLVLRTALTRRSSTQAIRLGVFLAPCLLALEREFAIIHTVSVPWSKSQAVVFKDMWNKLSYEEKLDLTAECLKPKGPQRTKKSNP